MDGNNRNNHVPPCGPNPVFPVNRLAERGGHFFGRSHDIAREEFFLESVRRAIDFDDQTGTENEARHTWPDDEETDGWLTDPYPVSAEDIRLHAKLVERLMLLHYERHGLWPRIRQFLFGNRRVR